MGKTDFSFYFDSCESLVSIPENLFINNPQITDFTSCFDFCTSLTTIPDGLFDNNPNVTTFERCFHWCENLMSIPQGLFDKNIEAYNFVECFIYCAKLTVNVQIGSTTTDIVDVFDFAEGTSTKGTVYCRAGSNAYNAFLEDSSANVNVLTY